jgi:TIR domain
MQPIETAMSTLAQGLNSWADELDLLDDLILTRTNRELHRLNELTVLREICEANGHSLLGSTVTLVRRSTRESFSVAVGVTAASPSKREPSLLSWQFGFWCDAAGHEGSLISPVYALPADAGSLVVLEQLQPATNESLRLFIEGSSVTSRAFISYVREDAAAVDQLCEDLGRHGVATWKDRDRLEPGERWKDAIRAAIKAGSGFVACFSDAYELRQRTYMNEELNIAVEELRLRPRARSWFFPVLLDDVEVPLIPIGPGENLRDLQAVSLAADWSSGIGRLARAIRAADASLDP